MPHPSEKDSRADYLLRIDRQTLEVMRPFAEARSLTPPELAKRLLLTLAHDRLIGAVLDDETENA